VVELGLPAWSRGMHIALASLLWGTVVAVAALTTRSAEAVSTTAASQLSDGIRPRAEAAV
jgi:hypothetical protein